MPYGKIHESFFSSSIVETDLETRFVFIAMIVLSDQDGRLDVTRSALARRINVPLATVDRAISILSAPDELSRTPDNDGRRILPIDATRSWGWIIINKGIYRHSSDDERRVQARERKRRQRARDSEVTPPLHSSTDADTTYRSQIADTDSHARHVESRQIRDTRRKRTSFAADSPEMTLAILLRNMRREAGCLHTEPDLQRWAATFSEVLTIDGRDPGLVARIVRHVVGDKRKRKYLQSPGALRSRWSDDSMKFDGWAEEVSRTAVSNASEWAEFSKPKGFDGGENHE